MVKFPEAENRLMKGKYVCRNCKNTIKTQKSQDIIAKKVTCPKCGGHSFRSPRKK